MTNISNETFYNLTLIVHVFQHCSHIIIIWSHQCRAKHYCQIVYIHLYAEHTEHTHFNVVHFHIIITSVHISATFHYVYVLTAEYKHIHYHSLSS